MGVRDGISVIGCAYRLICSQASSRGVEMRGGFPTVTRMYRVDPAPRLNSRFSVSFGN